MVNVWLKAPDLRAGRASDAGLAGVVALVGVDLYADYCHKGCKWCMSRNPITFRL
jgi:hypothetical protein